MGKPGHTTPFLSGSDLDGGTSAAALRQLFDFLENVQFWIKDRRGRYVWVNRAFLLNYSLERRGDVLGKTDHELSPPHLADQYRLDDERVLKGDVIAGRVELVGRYDHTSALSVTHKLPVRDARGKICGTAGITRTLNAQAPHLEVNDAALGKVIALLREKPGAAWTNRELARQARLSVRALERRFLGLFRQTPQRYVRMIRVRLAAHALVYTARPLHELALAHGFSDQSHFTRIFRASTGMTPKAYRRRFQAHG